MRKALLVGINYYAHLSNLHGCVGDAQAVQGVLERNGDGSKNFDVETHVAANDSNPLTRSDLKDLVEEVFRGETDIALVYFAGHGHIETGGGYLLTSDSKRGDEGVSLGEVLTFANNSKARNKIVILDSCHSGAAGAATSVDPRVSLLQDGVTILTASTASQYAEEGSGGGVFTELLVDALEGAAANLVGDITPGSIYAHIDQSLGAWAQRPVFKTNVERFVSLRRVHPPIELDDLRRIAEFFPEESFAFALDPSFEPEDTGRTAEMPPPDPDNTQVFAILQKYNRVNLVVPIDAPHMWHAAMRSKTCRLTVLGEHYRRLVVAKRL